MDYRANCAVECAANDARYNRLRCSMQQVVCALENFRQQGRLVNPMSLVTSGVQIHNAYNAVYRATYKSLEANDCMNVTYGMIARVEELLRTCDRREIEDMEPVIPAGVLDAILPLGGIFYGCDMDQDCM